MSIHVERMCLSRREIESGGPEDASQGRGKVGRFRGESPGGRWRAGGVIVVKIAVRTKEHRQSIEIG
jgi:hypothetical protein